MKFVRLCSVAAACLRRNHTSLHICMYWMYILRVLVVEITSGNIPNLAQLTICSTSAAHLSVIAANLPLDRSKGERGREGERETEHRDYAQVEDDYRQQHSHKHFTSLVAQRCIVKMYIQCVCIVDTNAVERKALQANLSHWNTHIRAVHICIQQDVTDC